MHEASLYPHNAFLTLTYNNDNLPRDLSLDHRHYQLFMKRLRRRFNANAARPIRYYMCGEYGEGRGRPHYHACLFNIHFKDQLYYSARGGNKIYTSRLLDDIWQLGECKIGAVTFESAAYVSRYIADRKTGPDAHNAYTLLDKNTGEIFQRKPEYNDMSRNPGIAAPWIDKYLTDVYPEGEVLVRNRKAKPPRYYDNRFRQLYDHNDEQYNNIKARRQERAILQQPDNTRARRETKERLAELQLQSKRKTQI